MGVQDFSPVRTLTSAKLVKNGWLNRLGLQVARTAAARTLYKMRRTSIHNDVRPYAESFERDGYVIIKNFLDPALFEKIREECELTFQSGDNQISTKSHGPTNYSLCLFKDISEQFQNTRKFFDDPRIHQFLEMAEKRRLRQLHPHRCIELVTQNPVNSQGDPETDLHSDIFYNSFKIWLYLTDVNDQDAPLVFVKGSHKFDRSQAKWIYRHSCNPTTPSRRITPQEMTERGLSEQVLRCRANTLVLANICAYHRRSIGRSGGRRMALHCSSRTQPFIQLLDSFIRR